MARIVVDMKRLIIRFSICGSNACGHAKTDY